MTAKLFAFNTLAGALRSSTSVVDGDTTAGRFDGTYVGSTIKVPTSADYFDTTPFIDGSASQTTIWARADIYGTLGGTSSTWIEFINATGTVVARLSLGFVSANTMAFEQWTGAAYNRTTVAYTGSTALSTWAFNLVCGAAGKLDIYRGGSLFTTFAINQAAVNNIAKVRFYSMNNGATFYSQVMGGDYDVRDAHLISKLATGEGTYTAGTGTYADINEAVLDETTAISLAAAGDKHSFVKGAIALPAGQQIGAMVINARGRIGTGVTDGKILCRSGSTDSASAGKAYAAGYEPRGNAFANDPATGVRWTQAGFNAAEFGAQAA